MRGIAEQGEIELLFDPETLQRFYGIGADADYRDTQLVELRFCVTKLGRLRGSTRRVRFGVKEKQHALSFVIVQ
jgi:hypothetical protein